MGTVLKFRPILFSDIMLNVESDSVQLTLHLARIGPCLAASPKERLKLGVVRRSRITMAEHAAAVVDPYAGPRKQLSHHTAELFCCVT